MEEVCPQQQMHKKYVLYLYYVTDIGYGYS